MAINEKRAHNMRIDLDNCYNDFTEQGAEEIILSHLNMSDENVNELYDFYTVTA